MKPIPFNKSSVQGNELKYIEQAIANGHLSGDGIFTYKCNTLLENELNVKKLCLLLHVHMH